MEPLLFKNCFYHNLLEMHRGVVAGWLRQLWAYCNVDTIFMSMIFMQSTNQRHIYRSIIAGAGFYRFDLYSFQSIRYL